MKNFLNHVLVKLINTWNKDLNNFRDTRIRTLDLRNPNATRYQTALHPDTFKIKYTIQNNISYEIKAKANRINIDCS